MKLLLQSKKEFDNWKNDLQVKDWLSVPCSPTSFPAVAVWEVRADNPPGSWYSISVQYVYPIDFEIPNGGTMTSPSPRRKNLTWEEAVAHQNVEQINRYLREKGFKLVKFPSSTVAYKDGVNLWRSGSPKAAVKRLQKQFPEAWQQT